MRHLAIVVVDCEVEIRNDGLKLRNSGRELVAVELSPSFRELFRCCFRRSSCLPELSDRDPESDHGEYQRKPVMPTGSGRRIKPPHSPPPQI